ncbi:hypothetical protein DOTSEDRAFT_143988 [Dothistroma septosporum NZE10]|uniref:RING-CH-type domain-containing protein n=1 Tax=Dothistroma septosporum (strain NZE10 / CBS 128990) TaxID=675120 RepID=N1Q221_DOTSN|nr:hypothetical protein DOTSEDRAFT_143988 [Dothistroma septosporum NZE10]
MAACTTGSSWSFDNLPGSFQSSAASTNSHTAANKPTASNDTASPAPEGPQPKRRRTHYPPRKCRICLEEVHPTFSDAPEPALPASMQSAPRATYESEDGGRLLSPCKCKGTQKYVHEECLGAWRRADPTQKRNYWECPTCRYRYNIQRLTWSAWISSTTAQIGLTLLIFVVSTFVLGFFADPIINLYLAPVDTIVSGGIVPTIEPTTWAEHMAKGFASLGLLGFAKYFLSSPFQWFRFGGGNRYGRNTAGSGRDRLQQISWITLAIGISTIAYAVWKGVRAWSRRKLQQAGERVMDVPGAEDDDDED